MRERNVAVRVVRVSLGIAIAVSASVWLATRGAKSPDAMNGAVPSDESPTQALVQSPIVASIEATSDRVEVPHNETPLVAQTDDLLATAQAELSTQVNDSLDGFLYINHVLDQLVAFARLPVETKADLEYESDERACFNLLDEPEGTTARMLVLHKPFELEGRELRGIELEVQMNAEEEPGFYRDCYRSGPRAHISISYDEHGEPAALALILERKINPKVSRENGIDAYQGRYTSGAGYRVDFATGDTTCETFGLVNGNYAFRDKFQGISPLRGEIQADKQRVLALLGELSIKRQQVGSDKN